MDLGKCYLCCDHTLFCCPHYQGSSCHLAQLLAQRHGGHPRCGLHARGEPGPWARVFALPVGATFSSYCPSHQGSRESLPQLHRHTGQQRLGLCPSQQAVQAARIPRWGPWQAKATHGSALSASPACLSKRRSSACTPTTADTCRSQCKRYRLQTQGGGFSLVHARPASMHQHLTHHTRTRAHPRTHPPSPHPWTR